MAWSWCDTRSFAPRISPRSQRRHFAACVDRALLTLSAGQLESGHPNEKPQKGGFDRQDKKGIFISPSKRTALTSTDFSILSHAMLPGPVSTYSDKDEKVKGAWSGPRGVLQSEKGSNVTGLNYSSISLRSSASWKFNYNAILSRTVAALKPGSPSVFLWPCSWFPFGSPWLLLGNILHF